jgi:hypothetical protein
VLPLLEPVLGVLQKDSLPYAFFGRLLRCRLIAAQGGYAAALALLTQMEDLCEEWMITEADRANALRTVSLVEMQILSGWHDSLSPSTHASERTWCADRLATLERDRFGEGENTVLRLRPAIPVLNLPPGQVDRARDASQGNG